MAALRRINQDDLRNHNLSVVIDTMLRATEPMSRAELAKTTGLTKATMSLLVPMLVDAGVIREGAPSAMSNFGRPSTPLAIAGGRFCGIGMQINTDGYGYVMSDLDGTVVDGQWVGQPMEGADPGHVFAALDEIVAHGEAEAERREYHVVGAGLALPGLVTDDMRLLVARNLGWERLDLGSFEVVRRLGAAAGNEANMAALAQIPGYATRRRAGDGLGPSDSFLYISTDIGIGGAFVRDGRVVSGDHGFAGELGHVSVAIDGPLCHCGRRGCLEMYAGRRALVESAGIAVGADAARIEAVDELLERWRSGERRAVEVIERAVGAIASAVASAINILDVDTVVLGGIWQRFGDGLAERLESAIRPQVLGYPELKPIVRMPAVNERPALHGAACVGLRRFIDDPLEYVATRTA